MLRFTYSTHGTSISRLYVSVLINTGCGFNLHKYVGAVSVYNGLLMVPDF